MQVAILAGGLGTRLYPLTQDIPKALVPVLGKPFLVHQLELLRRNGATEIVMLVGHYAAQIEECLGDGAALGLKVTYSDEGDLRLGTAGAVKYAESKLADRFFLLFGDSYLPVDYQAIWNDFESAGADAMMTVYRNENAHDTSDIAVEGGYVTAYQKTPPLPNAIYINYGLMALKRSTLSGMVRGQAESLEAFLKPIIAAHQLKAHEVDRRFYEIGSPAGLKDFESFLLGNGGNSR
ncbi:MAG: sugar phosphate nucleotidyltransferase [Rhizomicrobium sp.]